MTNDSGDETGPVLTAVLLQLTQQAERLATIDQREADRYRNISTQLTQFTDQLASSAEHVGRLQVASARHAAILDALDGLDRHVAALATQVTRTVDHGHGDGDYQPVPAPRWWALGGPELEEALDRLRAWVDQVYRPGYGHIAGGLGACWEQHPLCLFGLDWLMELWSALYLSPDRETGVLASQAEWQTRLLPALAAQMHAETSRCQHRRTAQALIER